ncbi:Udp-Galnac:Beta-1,3-N-Acetylgalactosaminyltransferase 1, partial [Manis pentadactyla]
TASQNLRENSDADVIQLRRVVDFEEFLAKNRVGFDSVILTTTISLSTHSAEPPGTEHED